MYFFLLLTFLLYWHSSAIGNLHLCSFIEKEKESVCLFCHISVSYSVLWEEHL